MEIAAATKLLETSIETGDERGAPAAAQALLDQGVPPSAITAVMARVMERLGEEFHSLEIFVPDLLVAADAFDAVMQVIEPALLQARGGEKAKGKIVVGVVEGDIHTLGMNLVRVMLAADGFEVRDLGRDVKVNCFVEAAEEFGAEVIAMSALMTTTMERMKDVVQELAARGLRDKYRVMVGGAPVTQYFADEIGADGYAEDAPLAVALANRLLASFPCRKEAGGDRA